VPTASAASVARSLAAVADHQRARRRKALLIVTVIGVLGLWAAHGTQFNIPKLITGVPQIVDLLGRMLPPDLTVLPRLAHPLLETLEMALLGTTFAVIVALPLAFLAATNTAPHAAVSVVVRLAVSVLRTVPELIWAMVLVTAVGLGPFPGVIALTLHTIGGHGKLYYEAVEASPRGVVEAMDAMGVGRFRTIWYGIVPSILPGLLSNTLFYWEYNNRASTVLGLVGAGGIGFALTRALADFQYHEVTTCLILIVLILIVIDRVSADLRRRII
jgi:phosphonate transport system permease protein